MRTIGRGTAALGRGTGRGLVLTGRGLWWLVGWLIGRGSVDGASLERRRRASVLLIWTTAAVFAFIGMGTAGTVYDVDHIAVGLTPFIGVLAGLPLGLVLIRPLEGLLVSLAGAFLLGIALPTTDFPWHFLVIHGLAIFTLLFAVGAKESLQRTLAGLLLTVAVFTWGVEPVQRIGWVVGLTIIAAAGVMAGRLVSANQALRAQQEAADAEKARRVVLEERTRIARDLHDIVAHHMSLVVVQAETAPYRVADLSEGARQELESISASARSALSETRTMLNLLRAEDQAVADAPQPGLGELEALFDASRRAGVPVTASVSGDPSVLGAGSSLAAYRIVQEALSNVARHAPGASVVVSVVAGARQVDMEVTNGPAADGRPVPVPREGHGITGMRERAAAAGGSLSLGPTPEGGFRVTAAIPA